MGTWMETRISIYRERIWNDCATLADNGDLDAEMTHIEYNQDGTAGRGYQGLCATEEYV